MAVQTRKIGLSLGADTCWPLCFEGILQELNPTVRVGKDEVRFAVDRVRIKPFNLRDKVDYDLVIDRLTYWYAPTREWLKKAILMDGTYVWNNPWSIESNQKHTAYAAMMALGIPIPETCMVPPKSYEPKADLAVTLHRYADLFDLGDVGRQLGFPSFMKPYDGGGWVGVTKLDDEAGLRDAYEKSGKSLMHVQKGVIPFDRFVRCVGLGPQTLLMNYDPSAPLHQRYCLDKDFVSAAERRHIEDITLTINAFFGWDFNSCEALLQEGTWWPIDFANPCPDSQVTSLHYHFPTLVKAKLRWALFTAATKRPMKKTLDWEPFYAIRDKHSDTAKRISEYGKLARTHFDEERFQEFCEQQLAGLDEAAWNWFGSEACRDAVRKKVEMIFPKHEWDQFTEHFFQSIQSWRADDKAAREPKVRQHVLAGTEAEKAAAKPKKKR